MTKFADGDEIRAIRIKMIELLRTNKITPTLEVASSLIYIAVEMLNWGGMDLEHMQYIFDETVKRITTEGRRDN